MTTTTRLFIATSLAALIVAALLHLLVLLGVWRVWAALIHLMLLGWITGMVFAVNYHTMPVFAARDFPHPCLTAAHWAVFTSGVMLVTVGSLGAWSTFTSIGLLLQYVAALLFVANTVLLFRRGARRTNGPPTPPTPDQKCVDRIGTQATKSAGMCLPLALLLLLAQQLQWIGGAWVLAAEHLVTLGWIMSMIVGVAYHVLPRFSGRGLRGTAWARIQLLCHRIVLVLLVPGLGFGWTRAFALGALLMTAAIALFAWTIWPTITFRSAIVDVRLPVTLNPKSTIQNQKR
jgi:hypothetical protein